MGRISIMSLALSFHLWIKFKLCYSEDNLYSLFVIYLSDNYLKPIYKENDRAKEILAKPNLKEKQCCRYFWEQILIPSKRNIFN